MESHIFNCCYCVQINTFIKTNDNITLVEVPSGRVKTWTAGAYRSKAVTDLSSTEHRDIYMMKRNKEPWVFVSFVWEIFLDDRLTVWLKSTVTPRISTWKSTDSELNLLMSWVKICKFHENPQFQWSPRSHLSDLNMEHWITQDHLPRMVTPYISCLELDDDRVLLIPERISCSYSSSNMCKV